MSKVLSIYNTYTFIFYIQFFFLEGWIFLEIHLANHWDFPLVNSVAFYVTVWLFQTWKCSRQKSTSCIPTLWVLPFTFGWKTYEKISSVFGGNLSYWNLATKMFWPRIMLKNENKIKSENISFIEYCCIFIKLSLLWWPPAIGPSQKK